MTQEERFEKAEKITPEQWDGPVCCPDCDRYWDDVHQCFEEFEEEDGLPEYLWTCDSEPFIRLDFDSIAECFIDDKAWDGFEHEQLKGVSGLKQAIEDFNNANSHLREYSPNYSKAIVLLERKP